MAVKVDNVKLEVNRPKINFDAYKLDKAEKEKLEKEKKWIIATTAFAVVTAVVCNALKLRKRLKQRNK